MILRRIADAFRRQDWFTVLVETLIVVLGVFVGLQVSNWNAERLERTQERDYLIRLHDDFVESINGQTRDLNFLTQQLSDQAAILKSLVACDVSTDDKAAFQRGINTLGYINPPRIFRRTVDEMVAAGRTDIIRNQALKDQLSGVIALVEWRGNSFTESVSRTTEHYRYIIEEEVHYDLARKYPDPFVGEFVGVDFDIQVLCQSPQIARAISAISYATQERRRSYEPILQQYKDFLPVLEDELRSRWAIDVEQSVKSTP
jgi:hypothetical protein